MIRPVQFTRPTSGTNQFESRTSPFCPPQVPRTCLVISELPLDPQKIMTYRFASTFHDKSISFVKIIVYHVGRPWPWLGWDCSSRSRSSAKNHVFTSLLQYIALGLRSKVKVKGQDQIPGTQQSILGVTLNVNQQGGGAVVFLIIPCQGISQNLIWVSLLFLQD